MVYGFFFVGRLLNQLDDNFSHVVFYRVFNQSTNLINIRHIHNLLPIYHHSVHWLGLVYFLLQSKRNRYSLNDGPCQPTQAATIAQPLVFLRIVDKEVVQQNGAHFGILKNRDPGTSSLTIIFSWLSMRANVIAFEIRQHLIIDRLLNSLGTSRSSLGNIRFKSRSSACVAMQRQKKISICIIRIGNSFS
jgi:hypothetical protein